MSGSDLRGRENGPRSRPGALDELREVGLDELRELRLAVVAGSSFRLALSVEEAAACVGLSRDTLDDLVGAGELRVVRVGRRVLVPVRELERWLDRAARVSTEADG